MCLHCSQWANSARSMWSQIFGLSKSFEALVPFVPPSIASTATTVLRQIQEMGWYKNPGSMDAFIGQLESHCPLTSPLPESTAINSARAQTISGAHQWLDSLRSLLQSTQMFVAQHGSFAPPQGGVHAAVANAAHENLLNWSGVMQKAYAEREKIIQDNEAQNRALNERWVKILSGEPFIEVQLAPKPW